jgi:DNA topoisomerase-1
VGLRRNALKRRRGGGAKLLAYRDGRRWREIHAEEVNAYINSTVSDHRRAV